MGDKAIRSFEDLESWQQSINLSVRVYRISALFPKSELYGITSQIRRASSGVSANIAEGFGRHSSKEKIQFYQIAYGSLLELKSFFYLCEKLEYINHEELTSLIENITLIQKMINASMKRLRK